DQRADAALVVVGGGAHEAVIRDRQPAPHVFEATGDAVYEFLRRDAALGRCLRDLLSVLVEAGQEVDVVASHAPIARDDVGSDLLVRVADVRVAVCVVDRGREVEPSHQAPPGGVPSGGAFPPPPAAPPPPPPGRFRRPPRRPRRRRGRLTWSSGGLVDDSTGAAESSDGSSDSSSSSTTACSAVHTADCPTSSAGSRTTTRSATTASSRTMSSSCSSSVTMEGAGANGSGAPTASASARRSRSGIVRCSPSSPRSVTRSRKMSFATTFSSPRFVF